jgi:3-hydroxyacyl-CoA dehydrogenase/enoyl-CoA hydratase/3-hydroxybutyryl-CoA epimerase
MTDKAIHYAVDSDGIATITWDLPGRSMNVMNEDSLTQFFAAVDQAIADDAVKGVIIASAKRDFIAGADLEMMLGLEGAQAIFDMVYGLNTRFRTIETAKKPFVAALNGMALGGGYELALCCNYRVAAQDDRARVGLPEALVGLMPGAGGTQRLPRLIGMREALPLLLEGRKLKLGAALDKGMIHRIVPKDELLAEAKRWILEEGDAVQPWDRQGFRLPGGEVQSPKGYELFNALAIMSSVYEGCSTVLDVGLRVESRYFTQVISSPEAKAMIRTLFFSLQAANKGARRPKDEPKSEIRKIGMLGAGMMGAGIAHVSAMAGMEVVLIDRSVADAEKGKAVSKGILDKQVERGGLTAEARDAVLARITPTTDYDLLKGADLVIEAVFEDRALKAEVTRKAEAVIGSEAVFASNTSTLPISGLATSSARPKTFIGLHFFSPVPKMQLVEIIMGAETGPAALARAMDYVRAIGKTPIVVNDGRGFYTSRVFGTYVREGLALLEEGVNPALIENAGKIAGMPVGPLEVADAVSLDLVHKIQKQTKADLGADYKPQPGDGVIELFVEKLGRLGRKAGKGFYDYPADGPKRLWPDLGKHFPRAAEQPDVEEVKRRLMSIQGLETVRCVEEKVLTDPRDADLGSIFGWGFPPFTGGTLSYIDGRGAESFVRDCDTLAQKYGERFAPPPLLRDMAAKGERFHAA